MAGRPKVRAERLRPPDIIAAALSVAAARGVDALTMRSLAAELDVSPGAVYNHIVGRDELLDLVVEHVLAEVATPDPRADGWSVLRQYSLDMAALLDRYPGLDRAVIARAPNSYTAGQMRRGIRAALQQGGLTAAEARAADRAATWLWLGSRAALAGRSQRPTEAAQYVAALDALIDGLRGRTPAVVR